LDFASASHAVVGNGGETAGAAVTDEGSFVAGVVDVAATGFVCGFTCAGATSVFGGEMLACFAAEDSTLNGDLSKAAVFWSAIWSGRLCVCAAGFAMNSVEDSVGATVAGSNPATNGGCQECKGATSAGNDAETADAAITDEGPTVAGVVDVAATGFVCGCTCVEATSFLGEDMLACFTAEDWAGC
jgi:hypothetical protein